MHSKKNGFTYWIMSNLVTIQHFMGWIGWVGNPNKALGFSRLWAPVINNKKSNQSRDSLLNIPFYTPVILLLNLN